MRYFLSLIIFVNFLVNYLQAAPTPQVQVGADLLFTKDYVHLLKNKRIGLITNHTAVNSQMKSTASLLQSHAKQYDFILAALFAPEHGITGSAHAAEFIKDEKDSAGIPIFSLHGATRRPTDKMLAQLDLLLYDIQDIGSRSYTYITTLFYVMEEAAKRQIPVIVLDRPNPINGRVIDGPLLEEKWRSIVGYINVPYCHGMTVGELARYFNDQSKVGCQLEVIPMRGWHRNMTFQDTGLPWIPTSPYIPEATTAYYYPVTGILGELQIVNTGIGYTLPFKVLGAPWIDAKIFAHHLNSQKFPGVYFEPFYYRPFYGRFANEECKGVIIIITNHLIYKPVSTQYLLIGILKSLYPKEFKEALANSQDRKAMFCKVNGTDKVYQIIKEEKNIVWKLRSLHEKEREAFAHQRKKYLIPSYAED
ncbi:exo-beta-N-acetylmuramidase NamZ domain-containing protein [Neochlamydia sp. S13]|uniref:exo-beta-N-acetylmuramidase NamZ family protein n=1 Tax=Neochlamydia sp. S13 TaxID=1353976 RepID=UPI0005AA580C|nr:DUF1343 domain-containing protein [Neochlamydia sp. S13]BBI18154.1 Putative uncharacterized protein [Neochlamydia sp. S13]